MSLFVSSHYKNSPNDLQLLSDAPAHRIFVLCRTINKESKSLPDIYCAIQVCEEGGIAKDIILSNSKRGMKPSGDLIPWIISEHYQDSEFAHLTGVRIVRIACHPDYQKMGYGSRALELLSQYYEGKFVKINDDDSDVKDDDDNKKKKKLKPLLSKLEDVKPTFIYYLGTSFGLTKNLFNFWNKNGYKPLYLALASNDITGEHSCIMLKPIREGNIKTLSDVIDSDNKSIKWIKPFLNDFKHRFTSLLSFDFKNLSIKLSLSLLDPQLTTTTSIDDDERDLIERKNMTKEQIELFITKYDFKRLEKYSKNMVNYSMIIDLIPTLAKLFFNNQLFISLSYIQAGVLLGVGLQNKSFDTIREEFDIEANQLLAMFNKMVKKFVANIRSIYEKKIEEDEKIEQEGKNVNLKTDKEFMKENKKNILKDMKKELEGEVEKINEKEKEERRKYMEEKLKKMDNLNKKRKRNKDN
jgi:N-acetyltransferase 10